MKRKEILLLVEPSRVYGQGVIQGVVHYALQYGPWTVRIDESCNVAEDVVHRIEQWRGDGIISRTYSRRMADALHQAKCPTVELCSAMSNIVPEVVNDNPEIARVACEYLCSLGFSRFAFYSYGDSDWIQGRREEFVRRLETLSFPVHVLRQTNRKKDSFRSLWSLRFEEELSRWLKELPKPIALWCPSDQQAMRVLETCFKANISVPEQVAVLGVDNDSLLCDNLTPTLSSIQTSPEQIGFEAARILDCKMKRKKFPPLPVRVPPVAVIPRRSTDITAVDDDDVVYAMRMIRDEATSGLRVVDLLSVLNVSQNTLRRRFLKYFGRTPEQEIKRVKIEKAKRLLRETTASLDEIAASSGFCSQEYFVRAFQKEVGVKPARFRHDS